MVAGEADAFDSTLLYVQPIHGGVELVLVDLRQAEISQQCAQIRFFIQAARGRKLGGPVQRSAQQSWRRRDRVLGNAAVAIGARGPELGAESPTQPPRARRAGFG